MITGSPRNNIRRRLDDLVTDEGVEKTSSAGTPERELPSDLMGGDWQQVAPFVYRRVQSLPSPFGSRPRLLPVGVPIDRCAFFDTETTGLAGAGSVIFLFGMAVVRGDRMVVEQVFLGDFPGESTFLDYIERLVSDIQLFVSFNGKSFDQNILKTRFLMEGRELRIPDHLDLLYPARRLWSPITVNCRLKTLEEEILGIVRSNDIDGAEVPEIYFEFLRTREIGELPVVFEHNYADVATLARLLSKMDQALTGHEDVRADRYGLAQLLLSLGDSSALEHLRRGYLEGSLVCGIKLGLELKRNGQWEKAVDLWQNMADLHNDVRAAVELSKYYEHRVRDYTSAIDSLTPFLKSDLKRLPSFKNNLLVRIGRLRRKLAAQR